MPLALSPKNVFSHCFAAPLVVFFSAFTQTTSSPDAAAAALAQPPASNSPGEADAEQPDNQQTSSTTRASKDEPLPLSSSEPPSWLTGEAQKPRPPVRVPSGPRDLLLHLSESELDSFFDGQPFDPTNSAMIKILFHLPRFRLDHVHDFTIRDANWDELASDPDTHRIEMFHLRGRVKGVEREPLPEEVVTGLEFDHYFRVEFALEDSPHTAIVCARAVPSAWKVGEPLDQRASCDALFLHIAPGAADEAPLVFAANRISWHPDRADAEAGVTPSLVLLGELGMDVGLFDKVRERNRRAIGADDRECFYQLLAALQKSQPNQLAGLSTPLDLAPLLRDPEQQHGRLLYFKAKARRIMKIPVEDADIRKRFGIDHYYQIDAFLPLGDTTVRLGKQRDNEPAPEFKNGFPATVCALRLPEGMSEGESLSDNIYVAAYFFKLWMYKSQYISSFDRQQRQPSPMLLTVEPELIAGEAGVNPYLGLAGGLLFVVLLGVVWLSLWRSSRADQSFEREVLRRKIKREQKGSLNDLGIEANDGPDFSGLK